MENVMKGGVDSTFYSLSDQLLSMNSPIMELTEASCEFDSVPLSVDCQMPSSPMAEFQEADEIIRKMLHQKRTGYEITTPDFSVSSIADAVDPNWFELSQSDNDYMQVINHADMFKPQSQEYIVAPVEPQYDKDETPYKPRWTAPHDDEPPTPTMSTAADPDAVEAGMPVWTSRRARKSPPSSSRVSTGKTDDFIPLYDEDLKPNPSITDIVSLTSVPSATRGRKRSQPPPSPAPQHIACKKIKKYEIDDDESPSVRNARAAKANRDKKKKELLDLKEQGEAKDIIILNLREDNVNLTKKYRALQQHMATLLRNQKATIGLVEIQEQIKQYLGSVLPGMSAGFGPIPAVILAPGFDTPNTPGRYISSHFNLDTNTLIVGNARKKF